VHTGLGWNGNEILRLRHPVFKNAGWQVNDSIWLFFYGKHYVFRLSINTKLKPEVYKNE